MRVLVVDDEQGLRHTASLILAGEGFEIETAENGEAALRAAANTPPDLVLCDMRMPTMDGSTFLERYRAGGGTALVIMMSAYGDDDAAIAAIQHGAYDYIAKPFRADQLVLVVRKAVERERLRDQVRQLEHELRQLRDDAVVGQSTALRDALAVSRKVARYPSTVLLTGESGTGKEVVARLIHRESARAERPFVAVNCGAIPESLLESELFGHTKGAFTGATSERRGLFEEADGGTLLLDEIGELPAALQVKLLRALQESEIRRVGDNAARKVDVRVIAATARDLDSDVAAGRFRADLFYRLNVVRIQLPPLRDRREDIPALVQHFIERVNRRLGTNVRRVSPAGMRRLMDYPWPGNVRELENVVERAMVLAEGAEIGSDDVAPMVSVGSEAAITAADLSVKRRTEALERSLIRAALEQTGGNRTRAAELLELSHRALLYKIREYGLGE